MKILIKSKYFALTSAAIFLSNSLFLNASDSANYAGNTGVFETPNARLMPDWSMRMFINRDLPYTYYGLAITPLPFLEVNYHMTQLDGKAGFSDSDAYGDYKDKSFSVKLLLNKESDLLPSIVLGGEDIWGTGLYTSKYLAMSKNISYFDLTLGYAKGRLGGQQVASVGTTNSGSTNNDANSFMRELDWGGGKLFGSVSLRATPALSLMAEYSQIDYKKDKVNPFLGGKKYELPSSKINFGAKYDVSSRSTLSLSFQRGNQLSFGYNFQFGFSRNGMFEHLSDPKWRADEKKLKQYENLDEKQLSDKLSNEVAAEKFSNVQTSVNGNKIWTEFDNPRYHYDLKAIGRAISTIDEVAPKKYNTIYATIKKRDVPIKTIKVNRKEYDAYENGVVSKHYFRDAVVITNNIEDMEEEFKGNIEDIYKTTKYGTNKFSYTIGPSFKTYLNAKDKPLAMKISAMAIVSYDVTTGLFLKSKILHPLYNDIKDMDSNPLESNELSIRSQMIDYYKYDDTQLQRLTADYIFRAPFQSLAKIEVGYLDLAYAGTDIEWYRSFFNDRLGLGLQYQSVFKRPVDNMFGIYKNLNFDAQFLNAHFLLSKKYNTHLGFKIGKFLAGDKGVQIDFTRHYKGFSLGAYATFTNSQDVFTSTQNKGYINKGFYIRIPIDVFTYKNVKGRVNYSLSPWTRDSGQYASPSFSLYPLGNSENNINTMKKDLQKIIE